MLKNNLFLKVIFLSFLFLASSCSTIKQPAEVFTIPDFNEKDVKENEIRRISELSEKYPVKALWRSLILNDEKTISEYEENLVQLYNKAYDNKNYFDAKKYYVSLVNIGSKKINSSKAYETELFNKSLESVPGLSSNKNSIPKTMQDCVNATVTIWVDKGIAIHNGMGFADRVLGSGFFIDRKGYIVTNHHVISDMVDPKYEGYSRLYVKLAADQDTRIPAKVIGFDKIHDLALLKCEIDPPFVLELGSSENLNIGDKVNCIGTPLGLHGTVTSGIVSAVDRKLFTTGDVFQIDAAVNSGNSGGPCIDTQYKVQAIVFAGIMQYQGLNFAIPVEYLRQDLPFLYHGGNRKLVWVGGYGHTKKDGQKNIGLEIQYVMPGGVLSRAGLKENDVITFINGFRVYNLEQVQDIFRNFGPETILSCSYTRDGENIDTIIYLDERPEQPGYEIFKSDILSSSLIPVFGMGLASSSTIFKRQYTIVKIIRGSIADENGFSEMDPVYITDVDFNEDNSAISIQMNTRKRKKGYLDITMRIGSGLDSPYYF